VIHGFSTARTARPNRVDGEPIKTLLENLKVETERQKTYTRKLLTYFDSDKPSTQSNHLLTEPLSNRELEVLRLLRTELNGPEIANELMVSLNTMRSHTKNIYSKLGVSNRRAALRRAEELDLF
jgi:LuxR family maltose regulon positive regulatory protein